MIETETLLDIVRLVAGIIILSYASYTDIKTRRAANILWVIIGSIGGILLVVEYFTVKPQFDVLITLVIMLFMIVFAYVLFQLRLIFGGADAKAIMALAILVPLHPVINGFPLWGGSIMPAPWVIFSNSIIIFLVIPLMLFIYNLVRLDLKNSDPFWVANYLAFGASQRQFYRLNDQGAKSGLNLPTVEKLLVAKPDVCEQNRISDIVKAYEDRIRQEESYLAKLKLQNKGIMQDLLT